MIEPAFMRPDFETPIPGSQKTLITPALVKGDEVTYLKKETAESLGVGMDSITRIARRNASEELAKLTPRYARDEAGVIVFAVIDSDRPVVAATVLAPDFNAKFADTLGPDLLVAIPNRYRVYVYPELATRFPQTADLVLADYDLTPYPVSKEVFKITPNGLKTIGTFEKR